MIIYSKIVMCIATGEVTEKECYEYDGPVAECKGGSSSTVTVDYAFNARMASLAEKNQVYADEMFEVFKNGINGQPSEMELMSKQIASDYGMIDTRADAERSQLAFQQKQMDAAASLIPLETETAKLGLEDRMKTIKERSPVVSAFYEDAMSGVDVEQRVGEARAGVMQGFANANDQTTRQLSRMGIDPSSGKGLQAFANQGIAKATALAGAGTFAKTQAEAENFQRKTTAVGMGIG